jgi:TolA-binding protein
MDQVTELEFEIKALREKIKQLEIESTKLKTIIKDNDLDEEVDVSIISDEEAICVNEIRKLKALSDNGQFGKNEAIVLDLLYKNLRMIRGAAPDKGSKKSKKVDKAELFKIVDNNNG